MQWVFQTLTILFPIYQLSALKKKENVLDWLGGWWSNSTGAFRTLATCETLREKIH